MTVPPLRQLSGPAAPLLRDNVDTDAIIPSRETQSITRDGYGEKLFANWRYIPGSRIENPDFILNQPHFRGAKILLSGWNFGCGSSREAAAWSLFQFGIRGVIAATYGEIFRNNCIRNGVVPVVLPIEQIEAIAARVEAEPTLPVTIDLEQMVISCPTYESYPFSLKPREREMLLKGLDEIGVTQQYTTDIDAYFALSRVNRAWAYPSASSNLPADK